VNIDFLSNIALFAGNFHETFFLLIGAVGMLLMLYLRDYRLSEHAGRGYLFYLFEADRKKTDDVMIILLGLICAELVTGTLTGLDSQQLLMAGAGLGAATKIKAGGSDTNNAAIANVQKE
jgi:hypothetical protein